MGTKRRKIQMEPAFMTEGRGEAPKAAHKGTEVPWYGPVCPVVWQGKPARAYLCRLLFKVNRLFAC